MDMHLCMLASLGCSWPDIQMMPAILDANKLITHMLWATAWVVLDNVEASCQLAICAQVHAAVTA